MRGYGRNGGHGGRLAPDHDEVVADLNDGAADAPAALFDRYGDRIHTHCFRRLGSWQEAEDATASAFLEVWRTVHRVRSTTGPRCRGSTAWPPTSAGTRAAARAAGCGWSSSCPRPRWSGTMPRGRRPAGRRGRMQRVLDAIHDLPEHEREVLALVAWAGLTYEQAAAALDVPVGTIRSRLSRARKRLALPDPEGEAS